LNRNKNS